MITDNRASTHFNVLIGEIKCASTHFNVLIGEIKCDLKRDIVFGTKEREEKKPKEHKNCARLGENKKKAN